MMQLVSDGDFYRCVTVAVMNVFLGFGNRVAASVWADWLGPVQHKRTDDCQT
jgi:hypothetical protein